VRILDWIFAIIVCAMGVVHTVFAPLGHALTVGTLWSLGTGLALIFAAMLNVLRLRGAGTPLVRTFAAIANACLLALACLLVWKLHFARNPHAIVLAMVLAGEFLFSLGRKR
jgi:hypothetical protein